MLLYILLIWLGVLVLIMLAMVIRSFWLPDKPITKEEAKEFSEFMKDQK